MKRVLISVLTIIFIVSMITTVNAATGSINVGASSDSVIKGKTFTVTIAGTADNNITALQAKLTYDSSKLSIENKSAGTGFSDLSGSNEIAISAASSENLSKSGTLYTITFKVLDTAEEGNVTISITDATLALVNENSEQENVKVADGSATITIKADDTTVGNQGSQENQNNVQTQEPENTTTPSNTTDSGKDKSNTSSNSSSKNTTKNTTKNTVKKPTKLPQTGVETASLMAIVVLGAISIVSYVSYRKYKNI